MEPSELRRPPEQLRKLRPNLYPDAYNASDSLLVAFGFRCNLACTFCMVEDVLDVDKGCDLDSFKRFSADAEAMRGIRRVIFSGGEATMERDLLEYVAHARTLGGIEHVRIQTNATRLRDRRYLRTLLDAGVDEFFVSLHGHDPSSCDEITDRPGSFGRIVEGIAAIAETSATLVTNTVIAQPNYRHLAKIVALVAPHGPRAMEFWNIWPRVTGDGTERMLVRVTEARPHLIEALEAAEAHEIETVVKFYPRCLLGRFEDRQNNTQPTALIDSHYWNRDPRYDCLYSGICDDGDSRCTGLSHVYVDKFGWEQAELRPSRGGRRFDPTPSEADVEEVVPRDVQSAEIGETEGLEPWLREIGLALGSEISGWKLTHGRIAPDAVRVQLESGPYKLLLALTARDESRPCYARTPSFDISHARMSAEARQLVTPVLDSVVERVQTHDPGGRSLPESANRGG